MPPVLLRQRHVLSGRNTLDVGILRLCALPTRAVRSDDRSWKHDVCGMSNRHVRRCHGPAERNVQWTGMALNACIFAAAAAAAAAEEEEEEGGGGC